MYIHERYFKNNLTQNQSLVFILILQGLVTAKIPCQGLQGCDLSVLNFLEIHDFRKVVMLCAHI